MYKLIIRFKSGFELPITCENASFKFNNLTGEMTEYNFTGIVDNKPFFFRPEDIECIYQIIESEGDQNEQS